jgi:hypothetical protein
MNLFERKNYTMDLNRLTSAEITNFWVHYIRETMAVCVSKYALKCVKDPDIIATFEYALKLSNNHIKSLKNFFKQEKFPIPNGFTNEDVNLNSPPLFTEKFWICSSYDQKSMAGRATYFR